MFRNLCRWIVPLGLVLPATPSNAQQYPILEGLFKTILETQIERQRQDQEEAHRRHDQRHGHVHSPPGRDGDGRGVAAPRQPNRPAQPGRVIINQGPLNPTTDDTGQVIVRPGQQVVGDPGAVRTVMTYRTTMAKYVQQCDQLTRRLQANADVRGVRPLIAACMKLRNKAVAVQRQCQHSSDVDLFAHQYSELDAAWRMLSFRIQAVPGIDQPCVQYVQQMDDYCDLMCETLAVEPQFNRHRLLQLQAQGTAYIETLLDDIEIELHGHADCDGLLADGRRLQEQIRRQSDFIEAASYDEVVQRFNAFVHAWREYAPRLYKFQSPTIQRRLARIRSCGEEIYASLWMPPSVDRGYMQYLADVTTREMSNLFDQMTVHALVELPIDDQRRILTIARQLHRQCEDYASGVQQHVSVRDLRRRFRQIDQQWAALEPFLEQTTAMDLRRCGKRISCHYDEMRGMLGMTQALDYDQAMQLAAALEGLSEHLRADVQRYDRYYASGLRNRVNNAVAKFHRECKDLHRDLAHSHDMERLQKSCRRMLQSWSKLSQIIDTLPQNGLSQSRYQRVAHTRGDLVQVVAELAAMLTV